MAEKLPSDSHEYPVIVQYNYHTAHIFCYSMSEGHDSSVNPAMPPILIVFTRNVCTCFDRHCMAIVNPLFCQLYKVQIS